jgi:hypothetical protein
MQLSKAKANAFAFVFENPRHVSSLPIVRRLFLAKDKSITSRAHISDFCPYLSALNTQYPTHHHHAVYELDYPTSQVFG